MLIAVCDDDAAQRENLSKLLAEYFLKKEVKPQVINFSCGEDIINCDEVFDLAFLDVEMGEINGICVGKVLKAKNLNIILFIVTAHDNYLDDAFDLNVFRYLQKPIQKERLFKGLDTAMERNYTIVFEVNGHATTINIYDIVCVYAENGRAILLSNKMKYRTKYTLNFWKEKLYYGIFAQPHNSYIVNLKYVINCDKDSVVLQYGNGQTMTTYISQRKYYDFRRSLFRVIEGRE